MKLVIFDCDGTLVDSQHNIVAAMSQAIGEAGLPAVPRAAILSMVGLSLPLAIARLLPEVGPDLHARVTEGYRGAFGILRRDPAHHEPLYDGIAELLDTLSRRDDVLLGIATGKSVRGVTALLERMDLGRHFVTIQTADTNPSKPDPAMLLAAMTEAGVDAGDTVMIGDTTFDIEMARFAEVAPLGVGWGYHPPADLQEAGALSVSRDAGELGLAIGQRLGFEVGAPPGRELA